eukprot:TRINITY_DN15775_c0_g1_i1.p1 TRINITY_DN15775_c0_g1~~TRINITY_DN15775_c0_g1_i1.p1  ORF type:complete len:298 (-),score=56.04 TRINITY_DN15775_c0_g1_i1:33-926(-)
MEKVPDEIVTEILSYLDELESFTNAASCCKRFHHILKADRLWKRVFDRQWEKLPCKTLVDYHVILAECSSIELLSQFRYLAYCLMNDDGEEGRTFRIEKETDDNFGSIHIGKFHNRSADGIGLKIIFSSPITYRAGTFSRGLITNGIDGILGASKYEGKFDVMFDRTEIWFDGVLKNQKDGWEYSGQWRSGIRNGKGVLKWKNGFTYDGEWTLGRPKDRESAVCKQISDCLQKKICTGSITQNSRQYGQFMTGRNDRDYCLSCSGICSTESNPREIYHVIGECFCQSSPLNCKISNP